MTFPLSVFTTCNKPEEITGPTTIRWDTWGVPHIEAKNDKELFYAFGWAQMHLHGNLILKLYGTSRGQAAEYWGETHFQEDIMLHTIGFPELAETWYQKLDPEFRSYMDAFTSGLNDYADAYPESFEDELAVVLPIQNTDFMKHYIYVIYGQFVAGNDIWQSVQWSQKGSNTYAIGPGRTTSGNAMLVQNPHLPWSGFFTWIEAHLKSPETNMYGATLVGLPGLGSAFNEYLGWSHTNNTLDPTDRYELILKDGGYQYDGEIKPFIKKSKVLKVKTDNGIEERKIDIRGSIHGPVIAIKNDRALALKIASTSRHDGLKQWWNMGRAKSFEEFESALKEHQIPFFNIMYADRDGNIFYMFNGFVPRRPEGNFDFWFWRGVVPGDTSRYFWDDILTFEELPKIKNPESGWLQNANDPPWTCTIPVELNYQDFPSYLAPVQMGFRPQRSARMLFEDNQISFDELLEYKLSSRVELADRLMDDLKAAVERYGTDQSIQAMSVFETWDRATEVNSKGAVLFDAWTDNFNFWDQNIFEKRWDINDPINTPDGINNPEKAVKALDQAAEEVLSLYGQLDIE